MCEYAIPDSDCDRLAELLCVDDSSISLIDRTNINRWIWKYQRFAITVGEARVILVVGNRLRLPNQTVLEVTYDLLRFCRFSTWIHDRNLHKRLCNSLKDHGGCFVERRGPY